MKLLNLLLIPLLLSNNATAKELYEDYPADPYPCIDSDKPMIIFKSKDQSATIFRYSPGLIGKQRCELERDKFYLVNGGDKSTLVQNRAELEKDWSKPNLVNLLALGNAETTCSLLKPVNSCESFDENRKILACIYRNWNPGQIGCWGNSALGECTCFASFCKAGNKCPN